MAAPRSKPEILVLAPPLIFRIFESEFSHHFHFLKLYQSPLPLPEFLAASNTTADDVTAVLTTISGPPINAHSVLPHLPSLRCIVTGSAGTEFIDLIECHRRRIAIANGGNVIADDCADYAVALLLDQNRHFQSILLALFSDKIPSLMNDNDDD